MTNIPVADRLELQEITHLFSFYADTRQLDKYIDLFSDDGVLDESSVGMPVVTGRRGLQEFFSTDAVHSIRYLVHYGSNHIVTDYAGDTAAGLAYVYFKAVTHDGGEMQIYGYYEDRYVKTAQGWRFRLRVLKHLLPPSGVPVIGDVVQVARR